MASSKSRGHVQADSRIIISHRSPSRSLQCCKSDLKAVLERVQWEWPDSYCEGCERHYGKKGEVSCLDSNPKSIGSAACKNDYTLVDLIDDFGSISLLIYLHVTNWRCGPDSQIAQLRFDGLPQDLICPRCQAFDTWCAKWKTDSVIRLTYSISWSCMRSVSSTNSVVKGQELPLLESPGTEDESFVWSGKFRTLLRKLRDLLGPDGPGGRVLLLTRKSVVGYMLWHLLCARESDWLKGSQTPEGPLDIFSAILDKPSTRKSCLQCDNPLAVTGDTDSPQVLIYSADSDVTSGDRKVTVRNVIIWGKDVEVPAFIENASQSGPYVLWEDADDCNWPSAQVAFSSKGDLNPDDPVSHEPEPEFSESSDRPQAHLGDTRGMDLGPKYKEGLEAIKQVWCRCDPDSFVARDVFKGKLPLWYEEKRCEEKKADQYRWRVLFRSPGQISSVEPELRSDWCETKKQALEQAIKRTVAYFQRCDLLNEKYEPTLPLRPTSAEQAFGDLRPSVRSTTTDKEDCDASSEGPWINGEFCKLCETVVDEDHLRGAQHVLARCEVTGTNFAEVRELYDDVDGRMKAAPVGLPFESLHNNDMSQKIGWLEKDSQVLLFRIEPAAHLKPEVGDYGLLMLADRSAPSMLFGLSLEWSRGNYVRFIPEKVNWREQVYKIKAGGENAMDSSFDPEVVLREFHERMFYRLLPEVRPMVGEVGITCHPASALLVKLSREDPSGRCGSGCVGNEGSSFHFAWAEMLNVIEEEKKVVSDLLLAEEGETDELDAFVPVRGTSYVDVFRESGFKGAPDLSVPVPPSANKCPPWLVPVLRRWYRLRDLEMVSQRISPVFPALSPLAMEAVLTAPCTGLAGVPFDAYRALGSKVLGLLSIASAHLRELNQQPRQLISAAAEMVTREKMAKCIQKAFPEHLLIAAVSDLGLEHWSPPGALCKTSVASTGDAGEKESQTFLKPNENDLANIAEAFVGAYFLSDGGFFSAWQFYEWLLQNDPEQKNITKQPWEESVLGHLLFGLRNPFRGRTPSYVEFQVYHEAETGEEILRVQYTGSGEPEWVEYRRPRPQRTQPEERHPRDGKGWTGLPYISRLRTFISNRAGEEMHVPNKVANFLLGKPAAPMISVKPIGKSKPGNTSQELSHPPEFEQLQEGRNGCLWVRYKNKEEEYTYARSFDGGLGIEWEGKIEGEPSRITGKGLVYSEDHKTLKSPGMKKPLPNKVTEWLHTHRCLPLILTLKKPDVPPAIADVDAYSTIDQSPDEHKLKWSFQGRQLQLSFELTPEGFLLVEGDDKTLIYSEELKTWLSPTLTAELRDQKKWQKGVPIPIKVFEWLQKTQNKVFREPMHMSLGFRQLYFKAPWANVPGFVRMSVPRGVNMQPVEDHLSYNFNNPMLLVEALTHASFKLPANTNAPSAENPASPSNQRLACIGRWVAEAILTKSIIQHLGFPMHGLRNAEEDFEAKAVSQTFGVSALSQSNQHPDLRWLRPQSNSTGETIVTDYKKLLQYVNFPNNHITYAYICVQMNLHKQILMSADDDEVDDRLQQGIDDFAKLARHYPGELENLWQDLVVNDAPRALSDAFLAVVAAVFLDSDWQFVCAKFEPIFKKYVLERMPDPRQLEPKHDSSELSITDPLAQLNCLAEVAIGAQEANPGKNKVTLTIRPVLHRADDSHSTHCQALKVVRARLEAAKDLQTCGSAFDEESLKYVKPATDAFCLQDFHYSSLWINGECVEPPIGANSPKSSARRCATLFLRTIEEDAGRKQRFEKAIQDITSGKAVNEAFEPLNLPEAIRDLVAKARSIRDSEDGPGMSGESVDGDGADSGPNNDAYGQEPILCETCQIYLNGHTQMEDHRKGKKHRKNMQKKSAGCGISNDGNENRKDLNGFESSSKDIDEQRFHDREDGYGRRLGTGENDSITGANSVKSFSTGDDHAAFGLGDSSASDVGRMRRPITPFGTNVSARDGNRYRQPQQYHAPLQEASTLPPFIEGNPRLVHTPADGRAYLIWPPNHEIPNAYAAGREWGWITDGTQWCAALPWNEDQIEQQQCQ